MPYITREQRHDITERQHVRRIPNDPGELNFRFTEVILEYLHYRGLNYQTINDIVGALEQAKDEFRRRVVHRYEDAKKEVNGDAYAHIP